MASPTASPLSRTNSTGGPILSRSSSAGGAIVPGMSTPPPSSALSRADLASDAAEQIKQLLPSKKDDEARAILYGMLADCNLQRLLATPLEPAEKSRSLLLFASRYRPGPGQKLGAGEPSSSNTIVELNIGGQHYITTEGTLCPPNQENFFTVMLRGGFHSTRDSKGRYFIDRNGRYFEPLLDYLRTHVWRVPAGMDEKTLLEEASFFGLKLHDDLFKVCDATLRDAAYQQQKQQNERSLQEALDRYGPAFESIVGTTLPRLMSAAQQGHIVASPWFFPSREDIQDASAQVDSALRAKVLSHLPDEFIYDSTLHAVSVPLLIAFIKQRHSISMRAAKKMFVASRGPTGEWDCRYGFLEPEAVQKMDPGITLRVISVGWQLQWATSFDRQRSSIHTL